MDCLAVTRRILSPLQTRLGDDFCAAPRVIRQSRLFECHRLLPGTEPAPFTWQRPTAACRAAGRILDIRDDAAGASSGQGSVRIVIARPSGPTPMAAGLGGDSGGCALWRRRVVWNSFQSRRKRPLLRRFSLHRGGFDWPSCEALAAAARKTLDQRT